MSTVDASSAKSRKPRDDRRRDFEQTMAEITQLADSLEQRLAFRKERQRQADLLAGITPEDRERLEAELDAGIVALTIAMRAENDQLEAELVRNRGLRGGEL